MSKATCRTCGGEVPNHVPSPLDPNGIGNPAHAMSKQDDELKKYLTKRLSGLMHVPDPKLEVTTVPTLVEIIMQKIYKHFNPKSDSFTKDEVLRALGDNAVIGSYHSSWYAGDCGGADCSDGSHYTEAKIIPMSEVEEILRGEKQ